MSLQIRISWGEVQWRCPMMCPVFFLFTLVGQSPLQRQLKALPSLQIFQEVSKVTLNKCANISNNKYIGHMPWVQPNCQRKERNTKNTSWTQELLLSLSNLKPSVKSHAPHSQSSPGISRLWWVLVDQLPIQKAALLYQKLTTVFQEKTAHIKSWFWRALFSFGMQMLLLQGLVIADLQALKPTAPAGFIVAFLGNAGVMPSWMN